MKHPKLYSLLKALTKEEFKRLRKVVLSPAYTSSPKLITLYHFLQNQYPDFDESLSGRRKLFAKLFPEQPYKDQKFRRVFTDMIQVVEHYYVMLELEKNNYKKEKILTDALCNRNILDLFERKTVYLLGQLDKTPMRNADYFLKKAILYNDLYFHPGYNRYDLKDQTLEALSQHLDGYFSLVKMRIKIAAENKMKILNKEYNLCFLDAIEEENRNGLLSNNTIFQLYQMAGELLQQKSAIDFDEYQQLLFDNLQHLDGEDQRVLFYNGLNYVIRQSNKGYVEYVETALSWYRLGLDKHLLVHNDRISAITFSNIVTHGCLLKEFTWVHKFIESNKKYLPTDIIEEEIICCEAIIHLYQKEFKEVTTKLVNYSFSDPYILRTRGILIQSYFELFLVERSNYEVLVNALYSFENFMYQNRRFSEERTRPYINLVQILKGLIKRMTDKEDLVANRMWVKRQLDTRVHVIAKRWLLEKYG